MRKISTKNKKIGVQLTFLAFFCLLFLFVTQITTYLGIDYFTLKKAKDYSENTTAQIESNILATINGIYLNAYNISFNKFVQDYMVEENELQRINLNSYIFEMIQYLSRTNENINDIILIDKYERKLSQNAFLDPVTEKNIINAFSAVKDTNKKYYVIDNITETSPGVFAVVMPVVSNRSASDYFGKQIGICIIICNNKAIVRSMQDTLLTKNALSAVLNTKSKIMANYLGNEKLLEKLNMDFKDGFSSTRIFNEDYAVYNKKIEMTGWEIINIVSKSELLQDYSLFRLISMIVGLLSILIVSFVIYITIRNIYVPISEISKFLKNTQEINLKKRIGEMTYNNEISGIANDIDLMLENHETMTKRIFDQQNKLYEMELINKQAQLTNLFNQINPHFLYNTLENIRSLGIINNDGRIVEISTALASVLRYSIKSATFVTMEDELECIKNYMKIINIRYGGDIQLIIDLDESLLKCKILKMILQPIVENCVKHGFDENRFGAITVSATVEKEDLYLTISDNGKGIEEDRLAYIKQKLGESNEMGEIGLNNINKRIKLNIDNSYGLDIESTVNNGTRITIHLPFML